MAYGDVLAQTAQAHLQQGGQYSGALKALQTVVAEFDKKRTKDNALTTALLGSENYTNPELASSLGFTATTGGGSSKALDKINKRLNILRKSYGSDQTIPLDDTTRTLIKDAFDLDIAEVSGELSNNELLSAWENRKGTKGTKKQKQGNIISITPFGG